MVVEKLLYLLDVVVLNLPYQLHLLPNTALRPVAFQPPLDSIQEL